MAATSISIATITFHAVTRLQIGIRATARPTEERTAVVPPRAGLRSQAASPEVVLPVPEARPGATESVKAVQPAGVSEMQRNPGARVPAPLAVPARAVLPAWTVPAEVPVSAAVVALAAAAARAAAVEEVAADAARYQPRRFE